MIKMKIGIIGGTDGLGKTLIYYFRDEFEVYISGRKHEKGRKVADELNVNYIESNEELASISDVVIVAVPIEHTSDVIREIAPHMKSGSVMMDVTSIKEGPAKVMGEVLPDSVEYIPTHPIFGPRTTHLHDQVIVLTADKKGRWYDKVYTYLKNKNMRIVETTPQKHDYMMSIVQVLTHFSFISTASAIEKLQVNISETEDYESPIYNLMIDLIARIVAQNPDLTYNIQTMNPNGDYIRNTFSEAVFELKDVINNEDKDKFIEIANRSTSHMGDIRDALGRSDKAIESLSAEYTKLSQSLGEEVGLKHIYTHEIFVGTLESLDNKTATLKRDNEVYKCPVTNISILQPDELYQWKLENSGKITEELSCIFPQNANTETIEKTVLNIKNITDIKLTGSRSDEDSVKLTFEVTGFYPEDIENVRELFTGFGGKII